jgi:hypothetical protein
VAVANVGGRPTAVVHLRLEAAGEASGWRMTRTGPRGPGRRQGGLEPEVASGTERRGRFSPGGGGTPLHTAESLPPSSPCPQPPPASHRHNFADRVDTNGASAAASSNNAGWTLGAVGRMLPRAHRRVPMHYKVGAERLQQVPSMAHRPDWVFRVARTAPVGPTHAVCGDWCHGPVESGPRRSSR